MEGASEVSAVVVLCTRRYPKPRLAVKRGDVQVSGVWEEPAEPIRKGNDHLNMFERIDRRCTVRCN